MYDISEYLNVIGDYSYETNNEKFILLGTLVRVGQDTNRIVFHARIPIADIHIYDADSINLHGTINSTKISLLNCQVQEYSHVSAAEYINADFELDKIVIGNHYKGNSCIRNISTEIDTLNYFYMTRISHPQNKSIEEKFFSDSPSLIAETQYGKVSVLPSLAFKSTYHQLSIQSAPCIKYSFNTPKTLDSAITHIASIRKLFTFFADGYIEFNPLEYRSCTENDPGKQEEAVTVFLNQLNAISETNTPFLLTCRDIKDDFQTIVEKWLDFYQNSIYIPSLFFEIIANRAKGINEFLNLAQVIEIYSTYYREDKAKKIRNADPKANKKRDPLLKHRFIDIFSYLQNILDFSDAERDALAQIISDNRNFYTHYKKSRGEPSYRTVHRTTLLLRFVILALVYKQIGVSDQALLSCMSKGIYTELDESIHIILSNEHNSKKVLE